MKVLVIAVGNPAREDDAVAWRVAEAIAADEPALAVVRSEGLLPDLAARLADAGGVVFVDARDGGEPGTVTVERLFPAAGTGDAAAAMSPADLLALVERQHGHAPRAALVTVSGARFELGEGLSEPVADAVPTATRCVLRLADDWAAEAG